VSAGDRSAITLRALTGTPLADPDLARMIVATAQAIAERHGVRLLQLDTAPDRVTAELGAGRVAAVGFAAELRRVTEAWYRGKHHKTLWGEPPADDGDDAGPDAWKDA
jgi:hypothetical protein